MLIKPRTLRWITNTPSSVPGPLKDHSVRFGRCLNDFYCSLASQKSTLRLEIGARFVCPECFNPLKQMPNCGHRYAGQHDACLIISGGLTAIALCLLIASRYSTSSQSAPPFTASPSTQIEGRGIYVASIAKTLEFSLTARHLAIQQLIVYPDLRPMSRPVFVPARATPRANPEAPPMADKPPDRNREFSADPTSSSEPSYPRALESEGSTGLVQVTCRIETDGTPVDCKGIAVEGSSKFRDAALSWLKSGSVRFAPILHNGQPVTEVQSWTIEFSADAIDE
jgi:hypothetical protein